MKRAGLKKSTCSKWVPTAQAHICCHDGAGAAPILNMLISERRKYTYLGPAYETCGFKETSYLCTSHLPPVEPYINKKLFFSDSPRLRTKSSLLEHAAGAAGATGATGTAEVVSRTAARSPPPTRAGGQDDGSYTNSLK